MVAEKSPLDTVKLVLAVSLLAVGIAGFYYYDDQSLLYRVLGLLAVAAAAVAVGMTSQPGRSLWSTVQSSRNELRRVVWPTRQETAQTTLMVLIVVLLVSIFLWLVDTAAGWAFRWLTGLGS